MNPTEIAHDLAEKIRRDRRSRSARVLWSKRLKRFTVQRPNTIEADRADLEPWRMVGVYNRTSKTLVCDIAEDVEHFMKNTLRTTG